MGSCTIIAFISIAYPMNKQTNQVLKVSTLNWTINDFSILKNISFEVNEGDFVGVIGPNGAGKSSLLRCLYHKNIPDSGQIIFDGQYIKEYSRTQLAQSIAVVLQEPPMQFDLNVFDVIGLGLTPNKKLLSFNNLADRQAILQAAKQVGLEDKVEQMFNSLSGGEKQRVMIARAILQSPRLLLMDEPTNHLDIRHQIDVLNLAKSLGITVVVSLHDLNLAANFCDYLLLLDEGELVAQGKPEKVLTKENLFNVFSVKASITAVSVSSDGVGKSSENGDKIHISFDLNEISSSKKKNNNKQVSV